MNDKRIFMINVLLICEYYILDLENLPKPSKTLLQYIFLVPLN